MNSGSQNPFISFFNSGSFPTRDQALPFDQIFPEHYLPALDHAIQLAKQILMRVKESPASFENTILGIEEAGETVGLITGVYFNLFGAHASPELQALAKDLSPKAAAFSSDISLDPVLFEKIKAVHDQRNTLNPEQKALVEKYFKDFTRNGALLSQDKKEELRAIDQRMAALSPEISENVLKATNAFELVIENKAQLLGLPESVIEAAATLAQSKGQTGKWIFNLQMPTYVPFLQYAQNRELRKQMWAAFNRRAYKDNFDNQKQIVEFANLRLKRAQLLGFKTHAEFVLADRMAENTDRVQKFIQRLLGPSKSAAERDVQELRDFKRSLDGNDEVLPWDYAFLSEKLKEKRFQYNEEDLRPYFKLDSVLTGMFEHARRLFAIQFKEVFDAPKYHEDVRVFEVREETTNKYLGLFYTDFFPRETKRAGAWMSPIREQGLFKGQNLRPHIMIVCNFSKPTASRPALLSYDEVQTLFHEFGHALHGLLSNVNYRTLAGTNVYWDFVELPSQIMENWTKEREGLDLFARHYQTGEAIPEELFKKMKESNKFQVGYFSLRQLSLGLLDLAWHTRTEPIQDIELEEFETNAMKETLVLPKQKGAATSTAFTHIFPGGYSAGYYSYKWAEVLDADAFELFKEKGLFNREIGESFKKNILSRGGTDHPMTLYKNFRGREPDPNALLRRDGLIS